MPFGIARGLECPDCEGETHVRATGRANDGTIFLRHRKCDECGKTRTTAETWIPDGQTSIYALDEEARFNRVQAERKRDGYKGIPSGHPRPTDRLNITVKVIKGTRPPRPR